MKQLMRGIIECTERTDHVTVAEPRELQGEFPVTNSTTKSAIITGASGGIGGSIAKRLAKDGFAVVVNYAGKAAPAQSLVADIKAAGGQGIAVQADVAIVADVERLFSSVLAKSFPTYGAYIASKAGVEGLVHVLANELRGRKITVNAVAPGQVQTDLFLKGKSDARIDELKKMNPLERLGMPEDMANVVSFLAGPEGGWINSQVVRPNGGFVY